MRTNFLSPTDLARHLDVAPSVEIEFTSESKLEQYRRLLYSVNGQHKFQYRTRRVYRSRSGPTLSIIRLK